MFTYTTQKHPTQKGKILAVVVKRAADQDIYTQTECALRMIGGKPWGGKIEPCPAVLRDFRNANPRGTFFAAPEPMAAGYTLSQAQARDVDALLKGGFSPAFYINPTYSWAADELNVWQHRAHDAREFSRAEALAIAAPPPLCPRTVNMDLPPLPRSPVEGTPPTSLTLKAAFKTLYRAARRERLSGAELYRAALELTGEPHEAFQGPAAALLFNAVARARADVTPMRLHLQRQVLNGWGHGNPLRSPPMESPRFAGWQRQARRADALRKRLKEAGRLKFDAGNWVQCLIPVKRDKSPENFATMTEYATACAGTRRWFVGRWSDKTRAQYEHRFTPAEWDRLKARWEAAHSAPESAQAAPAAVSGPPMPESAPTGLDSGELPQSEGRQGRTYIEMPAIGARTRRRYVLYADGASVREVSSKAAAAAWVKDGQQSEPAAGSAPAMPETALSAPETAPEPQSNAVAALLARVEALEARLADTPVTGGDEAAPLSVITDMQENETMADTPTPTSVAERPKRTPAHERAIRRAWAERRAVRLALQGCAAFRDMAETTEAEFQQVKAAYDNSGNERRALRKALDDAEGALQRTATKRRRAVLKARDLQKRLNAEHSLVDKANERRQTANRKWREAETKLARATERRRANALLARQRTRELVTVGNIMHDHTDKLAAELNKAKAAPVYMDASGNERPDQMRMITERAERAETALRAITARAERAEKARDVLADAVESMGTRLANAEAAVRRMNAA